LIYRRRKKKVSILSEFNKRKKQSVELRSTNWYTSKKKKRRIYRDYDEDDDEAENL
jgi:hypothetical protein